MIRDWIPVFVLASYAIAALGQCVYNATHCSCAYTPGGGVCLGYNSGFGASTMCDVYTCGEGLRCDCGGTDMCERQACSPTEKYIPNQAIPGGTGTTTPVLCELVFSFECLSMIVAAPSTSVSPTPSATSSISPSPSVSPSTSPTPSISISPVPSPSPLPGLLETCSAGVCLSPLTCDCGDVCSVPVTMSIDVMADNGFSLFTCNGTSIGSGSVRTTLYQFSHTGHCDEWIVEVHNLGGSHAGMGFSVVQGGVRYGSGNDFDMLVALNPTGNYKDTQTYDYSSWVNATENAGLYPTNNNMNLFRGPPWNAKSMAYPGIAQYATSVLLVFKITPVWCPV